MGMAVGRESLHEDTYEGESRMLDSLEGICPGQGGLEFPATEVVPVSVEVEVAVPA
jgi:hypothetical protein